jgi:hypothetical protein
MAKRDTTTNRSDDASNTGNASAAPADSALEQRLLAFAEQVGRIAGTVQARAEGWMDREALSRQMATVRDGAAEILAHLGGGEAKRPAKARRAAPVRTNVKGRSGGVVDAPGKKHRKPAPDDPTAKKAASQAGKMRLAKSMIKTNRRRGRG